MKFRSHRTVRHASRTQFQFIIILSKILPSLFSLLTSTERERMTETSPPSHSSKRDSLAPFSSLSSGVTTTGTPLNPPQYQSREHPEEEEDRKTQDLARWESTTSQETRDQDVLRNTPGLSYSINGNYASGQAKEVQSLGKFLPSLHPLL